MRRISRERGVPLKPPPVTPPSRGIKRGAANDGQKSICPLAGRGQGLVPDQPASACTRKARLVVCGNQWSLCVLWRHGEPSATTGISPPSREDMAQVAGTSNARMAAHMGQLQRVPRPSSVASGQDHPPLHQLDRISLVRNRMREICASGSVGGEGGNALAYPAEDELPTPQLSTTGGHPR